MSTFKQIILNMLCEAIDIPPAIVQQSNSINNDFVNYIKFNENGIKKGFNKSTGLWHIIDDPDKRSKVIGYGHKVTPSDNFFAGITEDQALQLLASDLQSAEHKVEQYLNKQYGVGIFQHLSSKQKEMLTDFMFNLGTLTSFPKFTRAVLKNDTAQMQQEYKRFTNGKELSQRNREFFNRYLAN